jgi:LmbE family N-acetylglucosaminyl deacetylase
MTRRLAAVFAHPDDDTYSVAGSAALHADEDLEVIVILATSGDAGQIADPTLATPENLGAVREEEDRASWAEVGIPVVHHFLRYADGELDAVPREELVTRIEELLRASPPDVVVTFGPEGVTGHADHVTVGETATEAFHRCRTSSVGGFTRLLHAALPESKMDRWAELMRAHGIEPPDPTQPFQPRGVPDKRFGVMVDCSAVYERKLAALRRHRTQGEMQDIPYDLWPEVLGAEEFVQAWPERRPGDPLLHDVFEGLPPA